MFTKLVRTSVPSNFIFLPVIIIAGWWSFFVDMKMLTWSNEKSILLSLIPAKIFAVPWGGIIAVAFSILTAIIMIHFSAKYFHNSSSNLLPSVIFITLISQEQWMFKPSPACISLFFCMLALQYVFETYHQDRIFHFGFMAGFLSAIAALIYLPAVLFIIVSWVGLILLRLFKLREFIIVIVGFMVPLVITHAIFMLQCQEQKLFLLIENAFKIHIVQTIDILQIIWISLIGIFFLWGTLKSILSGSLKKIMIRRYFTTLTFAVVLYGLAIFSFVADFGLIAMLILPLSFIIAISITSIKKSVYASLFIVLLILLQIAVQIPFRA